MAEKSVTRKYASKIAGRDGGWVCHYCKTPLMTPEEAEEQKSLSDQRLANGYVYVEESHKWEIFPPHIPHNAWYVVDHKVPKSKGGASHLDNLVLACVDCNNRKGTKSYDDFVAQMGGAK